MHYLRNCSGFYLPSTSNPSSLTSAMVNVTCTRQYSGYHFHPHDAVYYQLLPSVRALAEDMSTVSYDSSAWTSLWYTGLSNCFITAITLPWYFSGRHWVIFWCRWNAFISATLFLIASSMITNRVLSLYHSTGLPGPNPWSGAFMGLTWTTTVLMIVVCALMSWQLKYVNGNNGSCGNQGTTRSGDDAGPAEEWKSEKTFVEDGKSGA